MISMGTELMTHFARQTCGLWPGVLGVSCDLQAVELAFLSFLEC